MIGIEEVLDSENGRVVLHHLVKGLKDADLLLSILHHCLDHELRVGQAFVIGRDKYSLKGSLTLFVAPSPRLHYPAQRRLNASPPGSGNIGIRFNDNNRHTG